MSMDLNTLSHKQKEAVTTNNSRVAVIATAGSGKTRTIIFRIWFLTVYLKAKLENILALSFTTIGVETLKEDIVKYGFANFLRSMTIMTIDKLAKIIAEDYTGRTFSPGCFGSEEDMFKEIKSIAIDALENDSAIFAKYSSKYSYIFIDEFQDVNDQQIRLIKALLSPDSTLFVSGDDDQNLYDWRGANAKYMTNFDTYYPTGKIYVLDECFRCTGNIVTAMNQLIGKNKERYPKTIKTSNPMGSPVTYRHFDLFDKELDYIIREIESLIYRYSYSPKDILIQYRTNELVDKARYVLDDKGLSDVTVSTMHSAKGSEFKIVFVASVNERYYSSSNVSAAIEAERRVLFVAISRASTKLYISSSAVCTKDRAAILSQPSRFISDIASCCQMPVKNISSISELVQGDNYYDIKGNLYTFLFHNKDHFYFGDRDSKFVVMDAAQVMHTLYVVI